MATLKKILKDNISMIKEIKKVLVANRGEIAIRVFRGCYDIGINTVAIYSREDIYNLFRTKADESYLIGEGKSPLGAYLDIPSIIALAKEKKADAIHPGYGFLAENPEFAKACEDAGIIFIGPPSHILAQMGDKLKAKEIAVSANVPTIPGSTVPLKDANDAIARAGEYGYPVILKAAGGGGGRGMRKVESDNEMADALGMVQSEALKAFGNGDIFMEKYLQEPKHIEVQILGDSYGNIVHLYERDCSVQRRYQKVVEYTPAFTLAAEKRQQILDDAVRIAKEVGYINAGTVEFLMDRTGNHYFIEMNPRIQVEHTVTEVVTGIDLVKAQIQIARGLPLDSPEIGIKNQEAVQSRGFAIQCRITTEDPTNNFAPDTGRITAYRSSGGYGIRLDAGNAFPGAIITPYYDSLLVKLTSFDRSFEGTCRRMLRALNEMRVRGVKTNIAFLMNIISHHTFQSGLATTKFIDESKELFDVNPSRDRAAKILKYIGDMSINRSKKPCFEEPKAPAVTAGNESLGSIKQMLDSKGPEAVRNWVLTQNKLLLTDTTFRDAHQSLLATRMRTKDMVRIAPATAHILKDAFSMETWGGATFDVAYRFLHESPWRRLQELRKAIPNIPFQMLLRGANAVGYTNYPDNVIKAFIKEAAEAGVDVFRTFDCLNWLPGMQLALEEVIKNGKIAEGTICYTGDISDPKRDRFTLEYYVKLAKELENIGCHFLAIKDMAGLLKPYSAYKLVKTLKEEIGIPIHLHTHDTSGNQVATYLMAAQAGVDIVDCAISSLSSLTSQPSINAVVAALQGQERDTGFDLDELQKLTDYWAQVRPWYAEFASDMITPAADVYRYEIPGGQYTNLKPQVEGMGLGERFYDVKEKYREVNFMLGDIVKVTPSSKMVGDMAIFMVQNNLTKDNILEKGQDLAYPDSVESYFSGMMGQPSWGFPKALQKLVLKNQEPITTRPGKLLPPVDFEEIKKKIKPYKDEPTMQDIVSWVMYPKVLEDYLKNHEENRDISRLDTHVFFMGMAPGETTSIEIEEGKTLIIKYLGSGEANEDGTRNLIFELNGARREIAVKDNSLVASENITVFADPSDSLQIGASIPGAVSKVLVKEGDSVSENQSLIILEGMKMEVSVASKNAGIVEKILVSVGHSIKAGELLIKLK